MVILVNFALVLYCLYQYEPSFFTGKKKEGALHKWRRIEKLKNWFSFLFIKVHTQKTLLRGIDGSV